MRHEFLQKIEQRLQELDEQLLRLQQKYEESENSVKADLQQQIRVLEKKRENLDEKIAQIKNSGESAWLELKDGVEKAWDELQKAVMRASGKF
ncbi:MAG: hypothetical protein JXQ27_12720 [Acidobacteria bacterium]|nr:hypothetical protein [Acidobacteriota bacterium]